MLPVQRVQLFVNQKEFIVSLGSASRRNATSERKRHTIIPFRSTTVLSERSLILEPIKLQASPLRFLAADVIDEELLAIPAILTLLISH